MRLRFGVLAGETEQVSRLGRKTVEYLRNAAVEQVTDGNWAGVDFLLQLDAAPLSPELLDTPRYGVWRFAPASPGPLAFWDVFDGLYHLEIRLDRLTRDPRRRISLDRRWIKVDRLSYHKTLEAAIDEMARMPAYVARSGPAELGEAVFFPAERTQQPSAWDRAMLSLKLLSRRIRYHFLGLMFSETWRVGVVDDPITRFLDLDYLPAIRWLPQPGPGRFLADPFLAQTDAGLLLMAEDYDLNTGRGKIVQELAAGELSGRTQDAIVEDCHMSYPFLLRHENELYCIPESHEKGGVSVWRWDAKTRVWTNVREILPGPHVDPTPVEFEGRWWLFLTDKDDGVDWKLRIYFADSPWGPWRAHARNPVKTDIRSSRPGGTPFVSREKLYRPAQDSSKHYGWRLMLNQVTRLSPTEFSEEVIRVLDSDRLGTSGIHTLSGAGDKTVVDGRHMRFTPWLTPRILGYKLRRLFQIGADVDLERAG